MHTQGNRFGLIRAVSSTVTMILSRHIWAALALRVQTFMSSKKLSSTLNSEPIHAFSESDSVSLSSITIRPIHSKWNKTNFQHSTTTTTYTKWRKWRKADLEYLQVCASPYCCLDAGQIRVRQFNFSVAKNKTASIWEQ